MPTTFERIYAQTRATTVYLQIKIILGYCALSRSQDKAHVRRGFIKAEESVPKAARSPDLLATRFVVLIGKLFAAEVRSAKWKSERRQRLRARYSARVLAIIERMLVEHLPGVVPSSLLGKALQYMSGQWPKLVRYVGNGNWPISNNWVHAASGMKPVMPTPGLCRL